MAPLPLSRFPPVASHFPQQFGNSGQQHQTSHAHPPGNSASNPANQYLNPSVNTFTSNGGLLALGGTAGGTLGTGSFAAAVGEGGLGGPAARMGFAHAGNAAHHQQQQQQSTPQSHHQSQPNPILTNDHPVRATTNKGRIRDVWNYNLHEEFATIRSVVEQRYNFIAMDTEFPGIIARPMGMFRGKSDYHYQCLRVNVDLLSIIQIGITLFNDNGETPPPRQPPSDLNDAPPPRRGAGNHSPVTPYTWQFNFKFSLKDDMFNTVSIESLTAAGIDFSTLDKDGIDPYEFAALLVPSGLVCDEDVKWISFHGGYDFGYLMKLLLCVPLPNDETEFENYRRLFFPAVYDVKFLMKSAIRQNQAGLLQGSAGSGPDPSVGEILAKYEQKQGLENIAEVLKVKRVGSAHQAGSDSLVTGKVFFQLRERLFGGEISSDLLGRIWGLGVPDVLQPGGWNMGGQSGAITLEAHTQNGGQPQHGSGSTGGGERSVDGNSAGQGGENTSGTGSISAVNTNGHNPPSTPNTTTIVPISSSTPAPQQQASNGLSGSSLGSLTPGGGTGVFGGFNIGGVSNTPR